MQNMRKHKRFKLDLIDLTSKMSMIGSVEIVDISVVGVAIKSGRNLNMGKECLLMLGYEGKNIQVKGTVVRSELSGIEEKANGEKATIYSSGILFKDEAGEKIKVFLDSIEKNRKTLVPEQPDWFYRDVRFSITTPSEKVLSLPAHFDVKEISQGGVIVQTDHQIKKGSMLLIELSFTNCDPVSFMGKVVLCRPQQDKAQSEYDIGVEFSELTDRDKSLIMRFMECVRHKENAAKSKEP
jgi:Tfp pilus assembly protein PilZ